MHECKCLGGHLLMVSNKLPEAAEALYTLYTKVQMYTIINVHLLNSLSASRTILIPSRVLPQRRPLFSIVLLTPLETNPSCVNYIKPTNIKTKLAPKSRPVYVLTMMLYIDTLCHLACYNTICLLLLILRKTLGHADKGFLVENAHQQ